MPDSTDLVALSLLWMDQAPRARRGRPASLPFGEEARPPAALSSTLDLEGALAAVSPQDVARRATALRQRAREALATAASRGLEVVSRLDAAYPASLAVISDPPPILWVRGGLASAFPAVAIVGSRAATPHGLDVAFELGRDLARSGVVVVSGLARGIDSAAHRGALRGDGRTIAVLGSGLDVMYPPEHAELGARIANQGALVGELPPGTPPRAWHFPRRNRIISGLASAVVVVEAATDSGSLITAGCALEQNRTVMAVPGGVLGGHNRGAHDLLRDGARLVESVQDVLEELRLDRATLEPADLDAPVDPLLERMVPGERYELATLCQACGLDASQVLARLGELELTGWVRRAGGGGFVRSRGNVLR